MPGSLWDDLPLSYLLESSKTGLESAMLKRLETAAILRKEIHKLLDECVQEEALGLLFQWFLLRGNELMARVTTSPTVVSNVSGKPGPMRAPDLREALRKLLESEESA